MKKLLIPTDFSDNAYNAALYGLALFWKEECEVILLNTYNIPYTGHDVLVSRNNAIGLDSKKAFKELIDKINNQFVGNKFHFKSEFIHGELPAVVDDFVTENEIDQVIMGTQGASGLKKVLIGSNTASVMSNVLCDLLVVPENSVFNVPKRIVLAVDDYLDLNQGKVSSLVSLSEHFDIEILLFHVTDVTDNKIPADLDIIYKCFSGVKHSVHSINSENVASAVEEFAKVESADMVAVLHDQKNFFEKLFHKSVTKEMLYHAALPILVLHSEIS